MRRVLRNYIPSSAIVRSDFTGHYATISHAEQANYKTKVVSGVKLFDSRKLVGLQHRVPWAVLEPTKSTSVIFGHAGYNYDFSILDTFIADAKAARQTGTGLTLGGANGGLQVVLMIEEKSFTFGWGDYCGKYYPKYMGFVAGDTGATRDQGWVDHAHPNVWPNAVDDGEGYVEQLSSRAGYVSDRWNTYVSGRYDKLIQGLASWRSVTCPDGFDKHPNFEGITIQESAIGLNAGDATQTVVGTPPPATPSYTPSLYAAAHEAMIASIHTNLPRCRAFWFVNFYLSIPAQAGQPRIKDVLDYMVANYPTANMGGPDVLHDSNSLNKTMYHYYTDYKTSLDMCGSMQNDSYREENPALGPPSGTTATFYTMLQQFNLAASLAGEVTTANGSATRWSLFCERVFWDMRNANAGEWDWSDAEAVIDAHGSFNGRAVVKV